ncbi:exodeoxyribonuclease V subunit alpha, partial [Myxococcota bacterium]|nr:exodeoxyribonuclease V subunit alpha [Myxococcota bacterium]
EASTVHRALGAGGTPTRYRHDAAHPLPVDVVLVDEASMVDMALMSRLVSALPADARLILLGDRDQLASVEAGAVLGDIAGCPALVADNGYSPAVIQLVKSHRFSTESGLGTLVEAVHAGDADTVLALLEDPNEPGLRRIDPEDTDRLRAELTRGYGPFAAAVDAPSRLAALEHYRILCAHRMGQDGLTALNALVESILLEQGAINPKSGLWYDGRPILVTQNDYVSGLYNGDVGVVGHPAEGEGARAEDLRVLFERPEGGLRWLGVRRLGPVETVFAMTVHKSQGSEFDEVLLVLPTQPSPVATRELLYTAISRARMGVCVRAGEEAIRAALRRRVERMSGLADALQSDLR